MKIIVTNNKWKNFAIGIVVSIIILAFMILVNSHSSIEAEAYEDVGMQVYENLEEFQTADVLSVSARSSNIVVINGTDTIPNDKGETEVTVLNINNFSNVYHIPNANYFIINPLHKSNYKGESKAGVCTTVALQLLMGYHNYYSDGRIIPSSISSSSGDTSRLLETDYRNSENDPVFKRDIVEGQGCSCIGTKDAFFNALNSYNTLSNSALFGQMISVVKESGVSFMEHNTPIAVRDKILLTSGVFSKSEAQSDIDAGRPIVLGMHPFNDELSFHVVVAYGYAKLDNVDGFLVHYGHGDVKTRVWVPASWFAFQIQMTADTHVHNYSMQSDVIKGTHREFKCDTCGVKKIEFLYGFSGSTINSVKYTLPENVHIPESIDVYNSTLAQFATQTFMTIGQEAFKDHTEIKNLYIPQSMRTIDDYAFSKCTSLSNVDCDSESGISNPSSIGKGAFNECSALTFIYISPDTTEIGDYAFV